MEWCFLRAMTEIAAYAHVAVVASPKCRLRGSPRRRGELEKSESCTSGS